MGRALRAPTRDAMLSHAATRTGAGWAFGLRETMDTTGAIVGPLAVRAALYFGHGYRAIFVMLLVPALLSMPVLLVARYKFPAPKHLEVVRAIRQARMPPPKFWVFSAAAAFIGAGYAGFSLPAYHFGKVTVIAPPGIPALYAVAMTDAAVAALALRLPIPQQMTPIVARAGPPRGESGADSAETRTRVGDVRGNELHVAAGTSRRRLRIVPYGFGVAWYVGSVLLGIVYDHSVLSVAVLSLALRLPAVPVLLASISKWGARR